MISTSTLQRAALFTMRRVLMLTVSEDESDLAAALVVADTPLT